jgi:adenosylhomocysteine nucleosidase
MVVINNYVILISADAEWKIVCDRFPKNKMHISPYGEWFSQRFNEARLASAQAVFFHGGWGKVAAAGSTQYVIDRWKPILIINLGTCGGLRGEVEICEILLVEKTVIYDIYEQMGDPDDHLGHYMTEIDLNWLSKPFPLNIRPSTLISGDRDLIPADIISLMKKFNTFAGDWESGSIAWVASRNRTNVLILRGVTDLIDQSGGEAYSGGVKIYYENTAKVMNRLLDSLNQWLLIYEKYQLNEDQKNK